jgi:hypothetical protein
VTGGHTGDPRDTKRTEGHSGGIERDTKRTGGNNGQRGDRSRPQSHKDPTVAVKQDR